MKFLKYRLLTITNVVRIGVLTCLLVSSSSLNSRNYQEYRYQRLMKRQTPGSSSASGASSSGTVQPPKVQRDWDFADVLQYFRNERLVILQFRCFFGDGPCDLVGKWAKDRVIPGFFGICKMCTPTQNGWFDLWLSYLFDKFPDLIRAALIRYLLSAGIQVPEEEVLYMEKIFAKRRYGPFQIRPVELATY